MNMKLFGLRRPTISELWDRTSRLPMGHKVFSRLIGRTAPYTGTMRATVTELGPGFATCVLPDRPVVRNHLRSVHAVALINLGELATGLSVMHAVDGRGRGIVTELCMEYHKKARGTITATCRTELPTTPGTHDLKVEAELRDPQGEHVATARATWRIELQ